MQFHSLNTKLRAMRGALFNKDDYETLCGLSSVRHVADFLREKESYRRPLTHGEGEWRRRDVEYGILSSVYSDFFRLRLHIFDEELKDFLNALFMRTLIALMKKLLCMVYDDRDTSHEFNDWDIRFAAEFEVSLPRLAASKTVSDFISALRGSVFHKSLNASGNDAPVLFELEQEFDVFYYKNIWGMTDKLDRVNREVMRKIIGTEIDLQNILWVYRFKKYYSEDPGIILTSLVPIHYQLTAKSVRRMINFKSAENVVNEVWAGPYGEVFGDFNSPEKDFVRHMRRAYREAVTERPFSIAAAASYLFEKNEELNNITTALEGVRYGLPASDIMEYLYL